MEAKGREQGTGEPRVRVPHGRDFRFGPAEFGGAFGDLGTVLPLTLGVVAVGGLAAGPVFLGFGLFCVATALHYRLPIPVQPMKAVAAVALTGQVAPEAVALAGAIIGAVFLLLGATGWITRIARLVPQSVLAGLQLGLGAALALLSLQLMASSWVVGLAALALCLAFLRAPEWPGAPLALAVAAALAWGLGAPGLAVEPASWGSLVAPVLPDPALWPQALAQMALPQIALTVTNAIVLTALIAGDYYGERATHVTPRRLSITTGLANLVLAPLGALPMCHGAGGLAAYRRFGARTGAATLLLGLAFIALALAPAGASAALLAAIPLAGLGALLLVAAGELALSRRVFDARPSCWPVIAATAGATLAYDPFVGLVAGAGAEAARRALLRLLARPA